MNESVWVHCALGSDGMANAFSTCERTYWRHASFKMKRQKQFDVECAFFSLEEDTTEMFAFNESGVITISLLFNHIFALFSARNHSIDDSISSSLANFSWMRRGDATNWNHMATLAGELCVVIDSIEFTSTHRWLWWGPNGPLLVKKYRFLPEVWNDRNIVMNFSKQSM